MFSKHYLCLSASKTTNFLLTSKLLKVRQHSSRIKYNPNTEKDKYK